MYWHPEKKLVYLAHPRTASRATRKALIEQAGFEQPEGESNGRFRLAPHHMTIEKGVKDGYIEEGEVEDWTIFTTVRNHFDALVSWYYYAGIREQLDLDLDEEWLEVWMEKSEEYFRDPKKLWALHGESADVLLRYENLEEDLNELLTDHGLEPVELEIVGANSSRDGRHYREVVDEDFRRVVERQFGDEMEELGYEF